jgi:hypothetical protein
MFGSDISHTDYYMRNLLFSYYQSAFYLLLQNCLARNNTECFLSNILRNNSNLYGILFDLPDAIESIKK